MRLELDAREFRLREPFPAAWGDLDSRQVLLVRLVGDDGMAGVGEAAPLEPYDGVSLTAVAEQLEACRPVLVRADDVHHREILDACRRGGCGPHALAGIDLALWDLAGRRAGRPVSALIGDDVPDEVVVNATIGAVDAGRAADQARQAVSAEFSCVKVKVGMEGDVERVAAVRSAVGPEMALRLDANGAWTVEQAAEHLRALAAHGVELCEEPVHGVAELHALRQALGGDVAIAMDETAVVPGACGSGAADLVCLKVAPGGGITGVLEAAAEARHAGMEVYVASTFDGPVGIAAGLHVAAALDCRRACGLATLEAFAEPSPFAVSAGAIRVPGLPGLGSA